MKYDPPKKQAGELHKTAKQFGELLAHLDTVKVDWDAPGTLETAVFMAFLNALTEIMRMDTDRAAALATVFSEHFARGYELKAWVLACQN